MSGNFTLVTERSRTNIRVEEYKRPTFKVSFLPLKEEVSFGHPVKLTGEAQTFSGINLQEGEINWTITRRPFWARFYMPDPFDFTYKQVANGTAKIDNKRKLHDLLHTRTAGNIRYAPCLPELRSNGNPDRQQRRDTRGKLIPSPSAIQVSCWISKCPERKWKMIPPRLW
ncbi:MAG: hypothetical protein ACLR6J_20490 [Parabacteroides merdae]